jgi:excisionase family DNA binding protein
MRKPQLAVNSLQKETFMEVNDTNDGDPTTYLTVTRADGETVKVPVRFTGDTRPTRVAKLVPVPGEQAFTLQYETCDGPGDVETRPQFLTTDEAADLLRVPKATLYAWRHRGVGPASARVGRRVLYRRADLDAYVAGLTVGGGGAA